MPKYSLSNNSHRTVLLCGLMIPLVLYGRDLLTFVRQNDILSIDGQAHAAAAVTYSHELFPSTFGWLRSTFCGIAFPNTYPPFMFWVSALLAHITLVGPDAAWWLRLEVALSLVATPVLAGSIAAIVRPTLTAATVTALAAYLYIYDARYSLQLYGGSSFFGAVQLGLYSQAIGGALLLLWLAHRLQGGKYWRVDAVIMSTIILCNLYCSLILIVLHVGDSLYQMTVKPENVSVIDRLKSLSLAPLIMLGLTAFWWIPVVDTYTTFVTRPVTEPGGISVNNKLACWLLTGSIILFGMFWSKRSAVHRLTYMLSALAAAVVVMYVYSGESFPNQPFRVAATFTLLLCLCFGLAASRILELMAAKGTFSIRHADIGLSICCIVVYLSIGSYNRPNAARLSPSSIEESDVNQVRGFARNEQGKRFLIEASSDAKERFVGKVLAGAINAEGGSVVSGVYREATPTSIFINPLVTALSSGVENFGISAALGNDKDFMQESGDARLQQLNLLGVDYVVCRTPWIASRLVKMGLERVAGGEWQILRMPQPVKRAVVLAYEPVLIVAPFSVKLRLDNKLDMTRTFEEAFANPIKGTVVVGDPTAPCKPLSEDLEKYSAIIVGDVTCPLPIEKLMRYSEKRLLFIQGSRKNDSADVGGNKLNYRNARMLEWSQDSAGTVRVFNNNDPSYHLNESQARKKWLAIKEQIEAEPTRVCVPNQEAEIEEGKDKLVVHVNAICRLPVLIKVGYNQRWGRRESLLAGGPMELVAFINKRTEIHFERSWTDMLGVLISAATLLLLLGHPLTRRCRRPCLKTTGNLIRNRSQMAKGK